jgi:hypothetical protein
MLPMKADQLGQDVVALPRRRGELKVTRAFNPYSLPVGACKHANMQTGQVRLAAEGGGGGPQAGRVRLIDRLSGGGEPRHRTCQKVEKGRRTGRRVAIQIAGAKVRFWWNGRSTG